MTRDGVNFKKSPYFWGNKTQAEVDTLFSSGDLLEGDLVFNTDTQKQLIYANSIWEINNGVSVSSGFGIPSSTPSTLGDVYIDRTSNKEYVALGTSSSDDWKAYRMETSFSTVSSNYTLALTDMNTIQTCATSGDITITIPANSSVDFDINSEIEIMAYSTGEVKIVADTGVTINGNILNVAASTTSGDFCNIDGQYTSVILKQIAVDEWVSVGSMKASI